MNSHGKIIFITKLSALLLFFIGAIILLYGITANYSSIIGIGIGVELGAIFIVLLGMFFVATEEMVETTFKGVVTTSNRKEKQPHLHLIKR